MLPIEEKQPANVNMTTMHMMENDSATVVSIDIGKTEICEETSFSRPH